MARGFESKDVEYQQAERERVKARSGAALASKPDAVSSRTTIELSLASARAQLEAASLPAHRAMLEQAIAALEANLRSVSSR
jgi:hypothetical protein